MSPVYRIEAYGEAAVPYPTLADALRLGPQGAESYIATSPGGVHLADALPVRGCGTILRWRLTRPGQDVIDQSGWTAGAPTMSEREFDDILALALREDFEAAS